jgi:peptide/nickel transport system permease protein
LGIAAAARHVRALDALAAATSQIGMSVPGFWLGILLLLAFAVALPWFPLFGADSPAHFVLPALALGLVEGAVLLRIVRASVLEELSREYVLAARAKGLSEAAILYGHVLRNALPPVISLAGIQFGGLLGGAVIIEQVFSIPGLGRLLLNGIAGRDLPLIQGCVLVLAFLYSFTSWLADILAALANPRISLR